MGRSVRWVVIICLAVVLAPFPVMCGLLWLDATDDEADRYSSGRDAVWLGHAWVDGRRTDADVAVLAGRLRGTGVRDLFVHTGPLRDDGSLDPALAPAAVDMVARLKAALPGTRVQSWLGQRVTLGRLNLENDATQDRILDSARAVLGLGFDGVHYNFEPVFDGKPGLLEVLNRTRDLIRGDGRVVSVSAHQIEPLWGMRYLSTESGLTPKLWSADYVRQVATRVDQIVVMSYDTALPLRSLYTGYVARQTRRAAEAVPAETQLIMGVPAFNEESPTHDPAVENPAVALDGIRRGMGDRAVGAALYVDFAATEDDWRAFRERWTARG